MVSSTARATPSPMLRRCVAYRRRILSRCSRTILIPNTMCPARARRQVRWRSRNRPRRVRRGACAKNAELVLRKVARVLAHDRAADRGVPDERPEVHGERCRSIAVENSAIVCQFTLLAVRIGPLAGTIPDCRKGAAPMTTRTCRRRSSSRPVLKNPPGSEWSKSVK